jgi:hypothetical protein
VLTLLDVIEHFPDGTAAELVAKLMQALRPELALVVVKVPVSSGLLYRMASTLSAVGARSALEQFYQVGTDPPHHHYFSIESARRVLERARLEIVDTARDIDFEPRLLQERARAARGLPPPLVHAVARVAGSAASLLGMQDSAIFFAHPAG